MNVLWAVARYEFKMQRRSLVFWLTAIVLLSFLFGEVLPEVQSNALYSTSSEPIERTLGDGSTVDLAAGAREALTVANFSAYAAWLFADRMGLMSALFIGVLSAFVWGRDRRSEMLDVVNSRPVTSWQYVSGKYLGVVWTWGVLILLVVVIGVGWTYQLAHKFHLSFAWHDFASPVLAWMGVTLLYGTAFVMAVSLLLRSGVGTLLVHFFYWAYNVMQLAMFEAAGTSRFLSYWFFRFDAGMKPDAYTLIQRRLGDVLLNRLFYSGMTMTMLVLVIIVFQRLRERGTLLRAMGTSEQQPQSWWRHLLHRLYELRAR